MATILVCLYLVSRFFFVYLFCFRLSSSERGKKHTALFRACFDAFIQLSLFVLLVVVCKQNACLQHGLLWFFFSDVLEISEYSITFIYTGFRFTLIFVLNFADAYVCAYMYRCRSKSFYLKIVFFFFCMLVATVAVDSFDESRTEVS